MYSAGHAEYAACALPGLHSYCFVQAQTQHLSMNQAHSRCIWKQPNPTNHQASYPSASAGRTTPTTVSRGHTPAERQG